MYRSRCKTFMHFSSTSVKLVYSSAALFCFTEPSYRYWRLPCPSHLIITIFEAPLQPEAPQRREDKEMHVNSWVLPSARRTISRECLP